MRHRRPLLLSVFVAAVSLTTIGGLPMMASAGGPVLRYASPTGTPSTYCLISAPCDLVTAINGAPDDAEVVVETGSYYQSAPLTATLDDFANTLNIHGVAGSARPVVYSAAATGAKLTNSSLSDIEIDDSDAKPSTAVLMFYGAADHDVFTTSGPNSTACEINGGISDTECLTTGNGSRAVWLGLSFAGPGVARPTAVLRGDTIVASGAESLGLYADAGQYEVLTTAVTNSIVRGTQDDIETATAQLESESFVQITHSDYQSVDLEGTEGTTSVTGDGTDIATAPQFVAAPGNLAEAAGSPTIDRGAADPSTDLIDVAGDPRTLGAAPDMGAFEFLPKPTLNSAKAGTKTKSSLKLKLAINPEGLATYSQVLAVHGKKTLKSHLASIGAGRSAKSITQTVSHLKPHTKYRVHAVVVSSGGRTSSVVKTITTKKAPKKHHKKH